LQYLIDNPLSWSGSANAAAATDQVVRKMKISGRFDWHDVTQTEDKTGAIFGLGLDYAFNERSMRRWPCGPKWPRPRATWPT
jgi:hypothetical protein